MASSWRCVLVGSESLLIQCSEILERSGHRVVGVVTARPALHRWAQGRGIRVLRDSAALLVAEELQPFDYLFSVTNLSILPPAVIALPARGAINFHDGPLPEYAGLNTPVWALINGEGQHGITWHTMTAQVDRGDVLTQRRFEIADNETALTLNTKCFEAGIEGFEALVTGLTAGTLAPQPQTSELLKYFGRKDRPEAAGAIRWDRDAQGIAKLVRALDFGSYANPVGAPKALFGGTPLLVKRAQVLADDSVGEPGTISAIDELGVTVATGTKNLRLTGLETVDGRPFTPGEAGVQIGWRTGARFDLIGEPMAQALGKTNAAVCEHELFWRRRLETQIAVELPYVDRSAPPSQAAFEHVDLSLATPTAAAAADCVAGLVAGLVGLLARLGDKGTFDIAFADVELRRLAVDTPGWFASQVPLRSVVDFSLPFDALRVAVVAELAELRRRGTYANDLVARVPELRVASALPGLRVLPTAVLVVERLEDAAAMPGSELTVALALNGSGSRWLFDASRLSRADVVAMQDQYTQFMAAAHTDSRRALGELPLLNPALRQQQLLVWNDTAAPLRGDACVHRLIEEQAKRTPQRTAITCGGHSLSYAELDHRANQLARRLASVGVGPDVLVGLMTERSVEMMVGLLAIHKAGGAYVPLDPTYPRDRIAYMVEDSKVTVLLAQESQRGDLPKHGAKKVIFLDTDWSSISAESGAPFDGGAEPGHLAYVIYTSGSTGKPKGVMVEHRNVVNFFAGMDRYLGEDEPGTWLAVTSLSFDISVLELCWPLARGYHVVLSIDEDRSAAAPMRGAHAHRPLDFSLFYFSSDESEGVTDKYKLLLDGARYGDQHGFTAIWTPERHFHAFGGLYPNPAVTGAAIAAVTERVQIRAGSVVLPLHHPLRVAEEWSVVDNISKGRVGISFASGWQPNDFVLKPENFADNKNVMLRNIEVVRRLWRGEAQSFDGPLGKPVDVKILPRPVQKELPYWVTSAGNPETFVAAGRIGANVLTHLLGQTIEELKDKLAAYRNAWKDAGHAGEGYVSLMLHSFVGPDEQQVRAKVKQPLIEYLRSSLNLVKQYAWSFPAFKRREGMDTSPGAVDLQSLSKEDLDALLEHSFERYYETSGLFGTPESCLQMIDSIKAIGVDDVACLIDFGVDSTSVLEHLPYLNQLRKLSLPPREASTDHTLAALMQHHKVTHLQCTPSMARMLLMDDTAKPGLAALHRMMVGGEALPPPLAHELSSLVRGEVMNMYGPTETTIWSAVHVLKNEEGPVPLGRPLANQSIYVLDQRQQLLPIGVPGELVIGGKGVVRGYLHRPELTAERFVPHPFQGAVGGRVYRTGDLARLRPDGIVEFLGRLDHQVKVRGYRIELGEIEAALLASDEVREAVVLAREDVPGDLRLVAYLVAATGQQINGSMLRERLREHLPDFMLPAHFVVVQSMPQTPNGKIDRKALPAPDVMQAPAAEAAYLAPTSDLEETIAGIWRDVLKLSQVGTRDNFFDLGGHSLLAVQTHRRLKEVLQRELSITDIFRFPTIQSLSSYLAQDGEDDAAAQTGLARAQGRRAAMQRRQAIRPMAGTHRT